MDPVEPPPGMEKDPASNAASAGSVQKSSESCGVLSSSTIPSWPLGRPRSCLPQEEMISFKDETSCPSGQYISGALCRGGPGAKGLLGTHPNAMQQSIPPFLPPKKRVSKSPHLLGHFWNGPHNNSLHPRKTLQIEPKGTATSPHLSPANKGPVLSQVVIAKSAEPPSEDSDVDMGMSTHNKPWKSLTTDQLLPNKIPMQASLSSPSNMGSGLQMKTTSTQAPHKDPDNDVAMRQNNNSTEPVKMTELQPNKTSVTSIPSLPYNPDLGSNATYLPKGSAESLGIRTNDLYSSQLGKMRAASVQPGRLECSNVDDSRRQSDAQSLLFTPLGYWRTARKRMLNFLPLTNVEEVVKATTKKTRLNWGEGLAKYEREKREKELKDGPKPNIGVDGDHNNSAETTEMVACPDIVPALSCGSNPSQGETTTIGELGSTSLSSGANCDLDNNSSSMTEKTVCNSPKGVMGDLDNSSATMNPMISYQRILPPSHRRNNSQETTTIGELGSTSHSSVTGANCDLDNNSSSMTEKTVCNSLKGVMGNLDNSSTTMNPMISYQGDLPPSRRRNNSEGAKCDISGTSTKMTEVMVYPSDLSNSSTMTTKMVASLDIVPGANGDHDTNNSGMTEKGACPVSESDNNLLQVFCDDHGNSTMEKLIFPADNGSNPPQGVSGQSSSSSTNMIQIAACEGEHASSNKRNASHGAKCGSLSISTSTTEAVACLDDVPSFTPAHSPPQVMYPATVSATDGSSLPPGGGGFCNATMIQIVPHKLTAQGCGKIESSSGSPQGVVLAGEIIPTSHQGTSSFITTSNPNFSLTFPMIEGKDSRNLKGKSSEDNKIKKEVSFTTSTMVQGIPHKVMSQGNDKIESSSAASHKILIACEIAPPYQGPSSMIDAASRDFILTIPKVGPKLRNFSEDRSSNEEIKEDEQEWKSGTNGISARIIQSSSILLDGDESQTAINSDSSDGESTKDDKHDNSGKENPELYSASNESNHNKMQANMENPKSDKKCVTINIGAELGGNEMVQKHNDIEAMDIDTNDNDNSITRDDEGSPQHCVASNEINGTALSCNVHPMDVKIIDTIPIPAENEIIQTQKLISNEEQRICQLPYTSGPALHIVNTESSDVKFYVDLNTPHDVASVDVCSSQDGSSIDVNASSKTSLIDLNMPFSASMDNASDDRGPANSILGAKVDMVHDFTHVQKNLQSQTTKTEITKDYVNQPGCIMLFGKVILPAAPSETKHTSMQDNQIHSCSRNMTSNMTIPFMTRGDQSYPSGPWSTCSRVPIDSYHQSMFSNQMPHESVNGSAAWPLQSGRSASVNWRQMPDLNMTPHNMMTGGVTYQMGPGSSNSNPVNFDHCLPGTSCHQAHGPYATPSRTNGESWSRSDTRKGKEKME